MTNGSPQVCYNKHLPWREEYFSETAARRSRQMRHIGTKRAARDHFLQGQFSDEFQLKARY
jgi:hypothetical protein